MRKHGCCLPLPYALETHSKPSLTVGLHARVLLFLPHRPGVPLSELCVSVPLW